MWRTRADHSLPRTRPREPGDPGATFSGAPLHRFRTACSLSAVEAMHSNHVQHTSDLELLRAADRWVGRASDRLAKAMRSGRDGAAIVAAAVALDEALRAARDV